MVNIKDQNFFSAQEVASKFNVSMGTIARWRKLGFIKGVALNHRKIFYGENDILDIMKNGNFKIVNGVLQQNRKDYMHIGEKRNHLKAMSTICGYLEEYIRQERPEDIAPWITPATLKQVADTIGEEPVTALKPIYEKLNGNRQNISIRNTFCVSSCNFATRSIK